MMTDLFTHGVTGTSWPWMLPEGTPGTPVRDRKRKCRRFLAALLARLRPPAGARRAPPPTAPVPPPRAPGPDAADEHGADLLKMTSLDLFRWREDRIRPYVGEPGGAHRRPR